MKKVAIACQGGGSHTAFTAGVLKTILQAKAQGRAFEILTLTGTSGGAICALLAWYGLITNNLPGAIEHLNAFWTKEWPNGNVRSPYEFPPNEWLISLGRLPVKAEFSPYDVDYYIQGLPENLRELFRERLDVQRILKQLLQKYVTDQGIREALRNNPAAPELLIGACDVCDGEFRVFYGKHPDFSVDAVVASAAIPTLMKAVEIEQGTYKGVYWDGLFSQNPPLRELPGLLSAEPQSQTQHHHARDKEIWLIKINPKARGSEPKRMNDIIDRRNELAGNLSLEQEVRFINLINQWVEEGGIIEKKEKGHVVRRYEVIDIKEIDLPSQALEAAGWRMDAASKLDRSREFLEVLLHAGEEQGAAFMTEAV